MTTSDKERGYTDDQLTRMSAAYTAFYNDNGKAPSERALRTAAGVSMAAVQAFLRDRRAVKIDETVPKDELMLAGATSFESLLSVLWTKSIEIANERAQEKVNDEINDALVNMRDDVAAAESERDEAKAALEKVESESKELVSAAESARDEAIAASNAVQEQASRVPELEKRIAELERIREGQDSTLAFLRTMYGDIASSRVDGEQILAKFDDLSRKLDGE